MIDAALLDRYTHTFGETFTASLWLSRPGETVNAMMRAALDGSGPIVTDGYIASELATRIALPRR